MLLATLRRKDSVSNETNCRLRLIEKRRPAGRPAFLSSFFFLFFSTNNLHTCVSFFFFFPPRSRCTTYVCNTCALRLKLRKVVLKQIANCHTYIIPNERRKKKKRNRKVIDISIEEAAR